MAEATNGTKPKGLVAKLCEVMAAVDRVAKHGKNERQGYKYVTEADIADAVRGHLASRNIFIFPDVTSVERHLLYKTQSGADMFVTDVMVKWTFVDGDSGETYSCNMPGCGTDTGDKGIYKAITGSEKYILKNPFLIPTGDDPEKEEKPPRVSKEDWDRGSAAAKAMLDRKASGSAKAEVEGKGATSTGAVALKVVTFTSNEIMREWKGRPHPWQQVVGPVDEIAANLKDQDPHFLSEFMWRDDEYGVWYVFRAKADILAEIIVSMGMDAKRGASPKDPAPVTPSSTKGNSQKTASAPSMTSGTPKRAILAEGHLAGILDGAKLTKLKQKQGQYLKVRVGEHEASLFDNVELDLDGRKVRAFVELPNSLHQPVEFLVKPNGQYLNVVRILRLGCFEWSADDGLPIRRYDAPTNSEISDADLGI